MWRPITTWQMGSATSEEKRQSFLLLFSVSHELEKFVISFLALLSALYQIIIFSRIRVCIRVVALHKRDACYSHRIRSHSPGRLVQPIIIDEKSYRRINFHLIFFILVIQTQGS